MQVLHVISFLIERTGGQIKPCAGSLIQYLQTLWHEAQEHNMLKCAILTTLVHLVQVILYTCSIQVIKNVGIGWTIVTNCYIVLIVNSPI